jgi:hypothetical protein
VRIRQRHSRVRNPGPQPKRREIHPTGRLWREKAPRGTCGRGGAPLPTVRRSHDPRIANPSPRRASAMCACWSRAVLSTTEPLTTAPAATERLADRSRHALPAPQRRCSWRSVAHPLGNAAVGRSRRADGRLASVRASRACRVALTRATSIRASRRRSATRLGQRGSRVTWGGALAFMRKGSRGARSAGAFRSALELAPTTAASDLARRCLRRAGLRPRRRGSAAA